MLISSSFDSGSIEVIDATDCRDIRLAILRDHPSQWYQWFHFRASGVLDQPCKLTGAFRLAAFSSTTVPCTNTHEA